MRRSLAVKKGGMSTDKRPLPSLCMPCPTSLLRVQFKVKMVTSDDEQTVDIITEGDIEEITRFSKV